MWSEETWQSASWIDLISPANKKEPREPLVYIVVDETESVLYVGKTKVGLKRRLWQHMNLKGSRLGYFTRQLKRDQSGWHVVFMVINGDLDAAERHYIRTLVPVFNGQQHMNGDELDLDSLSNLDEGLLQ